MIKITPKKAIKNKLKAILFSNPKLPSLEGGARSFGLSPKGCKNERERLTAAKTTEEKK